MERTLGNIYLTRLWWKVFFLNCRAVRLPGPKGGAFLPATHFRARGGVTSAQEEKLAPEAGSQRREAGPGQVGPQLWRAAWGLSAGARQVCTHRAKHAERACSRVRAVLGARLNCQRNVKAHDRKATADAAEGARGPRLAATKLPVARRPGAPRPCAAGRRVSAAPPRGGRRGRSERSPFAPPPRRPAALRSFPARLSPDPPPFPLPDRDGRGLPPPPPPAVRRGPLSCRAWGAACRGRDVSWLPPVWGTSGFPVTRSPRRKGRDKARLFLCRQPGSTCAACGFLGTRGPRPGLAQPAACLELDRSGLRRQAWVRAWGKGTQERLRRSEGSGLVPGSGMPGGSPGARPRPLVRSAGCRRLTRLAPLFSSPTLPTAGPGLSRPEPMAAPLVLEKGSPPDGARDVPPGLGVPGAAPGRPIALPAPASSSGREARSSTSRTYPPPRHR